MSIKARHKTVTLAAGNQPVFNGYLFSLLVHIASFINPKRTFTKEPEDWVELGCRGSNIPVGLSHGKCSDPQVLLHSGEHKTPRSFISSSYMTADLSDRFGPP